MYTTQNADIAAQYNASITTGRYESDYEFNRWFIRARNRAEYAMTYQAIDHHVATQSFTRCLELGPGPGTWTRVLFRRQPNAQYQLVDISEAMREQFRLSMRASERVTYDVSDIMDYAASEPFTYFFSSRAVEYLDDKPAFFTKLSGLMATGAAGAILTKNPYHGVRKSKKAAHQGQIAMPAMRKYLEDNGFRDITFYPVVVRIPIISRLTSEVAEYLFARWHQRPLKEQRTNRTIESYLVTFTKS